MPALSCTAKTCVYNKNEYCSKGDILVDGDTAKTADETCCRSFVERKGSAKNSVESGCGCKTIQVDCKACECTFNKQEKCHADKITITGASACQCDETCCGSFQNTKKNNRHLGENPGLLFFYCLDFNPSHSLGYGKNQNQYQTYRSNPFQHNCVEFFHLEGTV